MRTSPSAHIQETVCLAENSQPLRAERDRARKVRPENRAEACAAAVESQGKWGDVSLYREKRVTGGKLETASAFSGLSL